MASSCSTLSCDTCTNSSPVVGMCAECKELYCAECLRQHKVIDVTKDHAAIGFVKLEFKTTPPYCFVCFDLGNGRQPPTDLCLECRRLFCDTCGQRHINFKATEDHKLVEIPKSFTFTGTVSVDSINMSSDFEACTLVGDREVRGAQAPVSSSIDRKLQQKQQQHHQRQQQKRQQQKQQQKQKTNNLTKIDMDKINVKITSKFNGKVNVDKENCSFNGISCLKDGRVLLLDFRNDNLKMFDNKCQLICTEPTEVLNGMANVSGDEIAVVGGEAVHFYTVTNNRFVIQDKVFNIGAIGRNISYKRDRYIISCIKDVDGEDPFIVICSSTGLEISRITSFKHKPSYYITLDTDAEHLYVSPYYTSGKFTCLSLQGQLVWEMDLVSTDVVELYNCLLVTSMVDNTIYLCNKDGTYRRTLIKDDERLDKITLFAYSPDTQQLFVTHSNQSLKRNSIRVLQLSF